MALARDQAEPGPEVEVSGEGVTPRAIVLGVVTIVATAFYATYMGRNLVKSNLPVTVMIPLVTWIGIYTVLKLTVPKYSLSRAEVLTIFSMVWVMSGMAGVGWAVYAVSAISGPEFFASPENRLREVALPFLPKWLFVDARDPSIWQVYKGLRQGESIPWLLWAQPFYWWLVGCLSTVMAGFFCSVLFFKQWNENERLVFPMAAFPVDMLAESEGSRLPAIFRNRVFWIGFACTAGILWWNIIGYFVISLPHITLFDRAIYRGVHIGHHFPDFYLRVQPLLMGLAYLCPLDILFSFWVFEVVRIFKVGMLNRTGFTVGLPGQPTTAGEITMLESHGAVVVLVGWSVWVARGHLKETLQKAFRRPRFEDDGLPVSYRTAWVGLLGATVCLMGWCMSAGITLSATIMQMVLLFICFFSVTKYAAATGYMFLHPSGGKGFGIIRTLTGTANLSPGSQTMMTMMGRGIYVGSPIRATAFPSVPHIFKMLGENLRRRPLVWGLVPVAYVVGFAACAMVYIQFCYSEGGLNGFLVSWDMDALASQVPYIEGTEELYFDPQKVAVWMVGGLEAGLLTILRARFTWWPFHPVALAFPVRRYAFCLLIVWVAKLVVIRYGGASLYRRSVPFWYGAIVGYLVSIAISSVVDLIWFPGSWHHMHGG